MHTRKTVKARDMETKQNACSQHKQRDTMSNYRYNLYLLNYSLLPLLSPLHP